MRDLHALVAWSATGYSPNINIFMKIFRVIGLGLAIVVIRFLVPEVFRALEDTFLLFFDVVQTVLLRAQVGPNTASLIQLLPQ